MYKRLSTSLDVHFVIKGSVLADMVSMKGVWLTAGYSDVGLYKRLSTSLDVHFVIKAVF